MWRPVLLLALLAALAACGGGGGDGGFVIETANGEVGLDVEIADTEASRQRGLMGRTELPERAGMLFLFEDDFRGGFWMKDTLIPLSIAFIDGGGRILRILDMAPCQADPCPVYEPGVPYRAALEVNEGAFDRLGVEVGDTARLPG